jgi:fructuronate reductase
LLPPGSPDLASAGAVLTGDVRSWERAKLRILNGAHSSLSYLGLLLGHDTVAEAMADTDLACFVEQMVREDVVPSLLPSPLDLRAYASETLARFRNPAIGHRLAQIAWDGSQKLPYRLLDTIGEALATDRPIVRLVLPIAAWMLFVVRQTEAGAGIIDPLAADLARIGRDPEPAEGLLAMRRIFPERLAADPRFRSALLGAFAAMRAGGVRACLATEMEHA